MTVTLKVTDSESGIAQIEFVDNNFPLWPASVFSPPRQSFTHSFEICCSNVHTINYRATDAAGNVEPTRQLILRIDARPPVVELNPSYTGPSDYVNWTSGNWKVNLTCDDPTYNSGLISSGCAGDSKLTIDGVARNPELVQTISTEGRHFVKGWEHDVAGNLGQKSAYLHIDRRAPLSRVLMRRFTIRGPDGVTLIGSAHDPTLADGTPGSGATTATFRIANAATSEFVAWVPATSTDGEIWTANYDLPSGAYAIQLLAEDRARNQAYSPIVEVTVIRVPLPTGPVPSLEEVRSIIDRFVRIPVRAASSRTTSRPEAFWQSHT